MKFIVTLGFLNVRRTQRSPSIYDFDSGILLGAIYLGRGGLVLMIAIAGLVSLLDNTMITDSSKTWLSVD